MMQRHWKIDGRELLDRWFGIDLRALAAFRIGLGLMLLYDLVTRAQFLEAHYSDFGVLPRDALSGNLWSRWYWSLHCVSGETSWQAALFVAAAMAAAMLAVGWHTRFAGCASWVLLASLQSRNVVVLQGGDLLLRTLLFWSLWLPWDRVAALDARRHRDPRPQRVVSIASAALLLQLAMMYIFSGFLKNDPIWERDYTAVAYALQLDALRTSWGEYVAAQPKLCVWMTWSALYLERYGPLLAFIPWRYQAWRLLTVGLFWSLHLGLIATMLLGHFPYLCILAWVLYVPTSSWDRLQHWATHCKLGCIPSQTLPVVNQSPGRPAGAILRDIALVLLLALAVMWNVRTLFPQHPVLKQLEVCDPLVVITRLDQAWSMFAPYPVRDDGWWVMNGTLNNGRRVNLWEPRQPPLTDKPDMRRLYAHERWRKYMLNLWQLEFASCRQPFLQWLVRRWNRDYATSPAEHCRSAELRYWLEESSLGEPPPWEELKILELPFSDLSSPRNKAWLTVPRSR